MIYEIDKYTDVLLKFGITPNQFYFCWLLYTKDMTNLRRYMAGPNRVITIPEVEALKEKDLILDLGGKTGKLNVQDLHVTGLFAELVLIEDETAIDELMSAYPNFLLVNGQKYPTKGLSLTDERLLAEAYARIIKKNKFLHARILGAVGKYKEQNDGYATMKIDKFITSKHWETISDDDDRPKPRLRR